MDFDHTAEVLISVLSTPTARPMGWEGGVFCFIGRRSKVAALIGDPDRRSGLQSCPFSELPPAGLEPARPYGQEILSLQRLPFRHGGVAYQQQFRRRSRGRQSASKG